MQNADFIVLDRKLVTFIHQNGRGSVSPYETRSFYLDGWVYQYLDSG
ncbi:MAG: hypothetical protein JW833_11230 [Prolixibacteraceae bacterium]|nr:hypothetical protein [Prolixibacteraceae bacterium]